MFDKLKDLWMLKGQMEEIKKRLDAMVIKVQSKEGLFDITMTGSQEVKEVKILKNFAAYTNAQIEEDLARGFNKALKDSQAMAAQVMGGLAGLTPPEA
ncbi:MAG: YbaB/EbfC family nucleoid-associated protein [Elusimicrobium sp.]|jgi:DNA-binding protein YbaB|nr:YbaB/EbfC family nucleoid-associated protein [Elusimicrobium sp.]